MRKKRKEYFRPVQTQRRILALALAERAGSAGFTAWDLATELEQNGLGAKNRDHLRQYCRELLRELVQDGRVINTDTTKGGRECWCLAVPAPEGKEA